MPRSLWSGSLSFGLINVPVRLFSARRDVGVHFNQLHEADGARIETRRYCKEEDKQVGYDEIGSGYELEDGGQVVLSDEDLATVAPRKTRTIDIEAFVDLAEVEPVYFDHPYFLLPAGDGEGALRAYQLLVETMGASERAALGRFVMRTKESLVLIRVRDGRLALTTMLFHDELRPRDGIAPEGAKKPASKALDEAVALIEAMSVDWDPARYEDRYRERLYDVIERKKAGKTIKAPAEEKETSPLPDLMAALEESLAAARGGK
ncbi:MAG TPA: Ku protein [Solirubrobacteraceae bacterium]|jgi:DNA end-binding protein Ku